MAPKHIGKIKKKLKENEVSQPQGTVQFQVAAKVSDDASVAEVIAATATKSVAFADAV